MELIWKELPGERIIYTGVSQGTVEGGIPLPEGRSAKEILSYTGEVAISSSSAREGEIAIEGVVRIDLICMDDKVFAFTSSAPFTHRIAADGVREGMRAEVQAALQSLEINKGEGGITLNAVADINAMVTASGGAKVLDGISGIEDDGSITDIKVVKSVDPYLDKEALRVVKTMPKWKPGKQRGKPVRCRFTLPVRFRLQ